MARARWLSLGLGASAAAIVLLPLAADAQGPHEAASVSIPDRIAGYSHLMAGVSQAPPGQALALYQRGFGVEFMDSPQAVVLAAGDDVYRRLGAAESRGGPETQGDPGPMLLSPDGLEVALGDHDTRDADLGIVDLSTGDSTTHGLPSARSVVPVAWAPDGSKIAYLEGADPTNPYSGGPIVGDLVVLDLESGEDVLVPGGANTSTAAFSPDGRRLAVQRTSGSGGLAVVDLASGAVRELPAGGSLAGPAAWSPDGRLLALSGSSGISFVDPAGSGAPLALDHPAPDGILGWTGSREVAVFEEPDADHAAISAYGLDGTARQLTAVGDVGSYGIGRLQLASGLLSGLQVRPAGPADDGPWPPAFRVGFAVVAGLAVAAATALVTRRRRPVRAPVAG
jgi:hypothetical protein